jgi:hypothetical protein
VSYRDQKFENVFIPFVIKIFQCLDQQATNFFIDVPTEHG